MKKALADLGSEVNWKVKKQNQMRLHYSSTQSYLCLRLLRTNLNRIAPHRCVQSELPQQDAQSIAE